MRKSILALLALVCAAQVLSAVPAKPGKFTRTLPDGRKVTLQLHGDEFRHWLTDESGRVVREDDRGFLVPSSMAEVPVLMGGAAAVNESRLQRLEKMKGRMARQAPARSGVQERHFPMILVQFPDLPFTVCETDELVRQAFDNLANQTGYSQGGATGSIHDYYVDNSLGQTNFYFDIFGPVTVSQSYAYYGASHHAVTGDNDFEAASEALFEAIQLLTADLGQDIFNPYDNDGDGFVDAVFMFFAGHNEAEGAPEETIWPHEWSFAYYDHYFGTHLAATEFGNVHFSRYSCASEYNGAEGNEMCGIGTAVHEFGHALGLPDLYDTNYDENGDGLCGGLYAYSPMANGSYNNRSRTPSYFTMEERIMMGWAEDFTVMPTSGTITIPSVDQNVAFKEETNVPGEYFVFECRKGTDWDRYVAPGLVIYHVDRSDNAVNVYSGPGTWDQTTAKAVWTLYNNRINANAEHPCYYLIPAADQANVNFTGAANLLPFPGGDSVTMFQWKGWAEDNYQGDLFHDISFDRQTGTVTMQREGVNTGIAGRISDRSGEPVAGATVAVYAEYLPLGKEIRMPLEGGPNRIIGRVGSPILTAETDEDGQYLLNLEGMDITGTVTVEVSAPGYVTAVEHITLRNRAVVSLSIQMTGLMDSNSSTLSKFVKPSGAADCLGFGIVPRTMMASISFSAKELSGYAGMKIIGLKFFYHMAPDKSAAGVQGVIDFDGEWALIKDVPAPVSDAWNYLDLSGEDLRIPKDKACNFGYAILDCTEGYPFCYAVEDPVPGGMCLYHVEKVPEEPVWWNGDSWGYGPLLISVILEEGSILQFNYIDIPATCHAGDTLDLALVPVSGDRAPDSDISWFLDDEPVSGTITLSKPGSHTLEARFTTVAGRRKVVEKEIRVE